jgi:hypothetical protein
LFLGHQAWSIAPLPGRLRGRATIRREFGMIQIALPGMESYQDKSLHMRTKSEDLRPKTTGRSETPEGLKKT